MFKKKYIDKTLDKETFRKPKANEKQMLLEFKKELKSERNLDVILAIFMSVIFLATVILLPNDLFKLFVTIVTGFLCFVSIMLAKEYINDYKATNCQILDVSCDKIEFEDDLYEDSCYVVVKSNNTGLLSEYKYRPIKEYLIPELNEPAKIIKANRNYYLWLEEPIEN